MKMLLCPPIYCTERLSLFSTPFSNVWMDITFKAPGILYYMQTIKYPDYYEFNKFLRQINAPERSEILLNYKLN
jgi:hypothetical protein